MFTVFDETEIDTLAEKSQYRKINVSSGEDRRLSSYVKVLVDIFLLKESFDKKHFPGWIQSRRFSHNRNGCDLFGQA